jgi:ABC-2 type transport system ATP-binding protein
LKEVDYFYAMSIQIQEIIKKYGSQLALYNVSLELNKGEVTGFLGPNGAGKSTLMKIITGYLSPDSGSVLIDGEPISASDTCYRKKIGYLPENNPLYPEMYIREYLRMVAGFYQLDKVSSKVEEIIETTGLTSESSKKIGQLSKGYKQRVGLAQALIHDPEILILDEPTSGLDPNQLDEIRNLIQRISARKTVLLSTHIMQEVEALCNRVVIINKGKIIADSPAKEMKQLVLNKTRKVLFSVLEPIQPGEFEKLPFVAEVVEKEDGAVAITSTSDEDIRPLLFKAAVERNWTILTMVEEDQRIESIFRELTQKG